ncbi:polyphosphate kinase 1 [Taibaiella soli]|uniref:Polyphosphate kinase n=1 Tax=Taibaiella soli TaxID=1649169 RepID=A0A2W2AE27_9BACT|nr:polyphosphate kinase 1 [Taibaiella soli]PZF73715.1 polyphosphate kinase 1 [Taibaiella soli]
MALGYQYFNRDISWLQFNHRVLQEAENTNVPVYDRVRFLSIFSSNLDEFFRVRYPSLLALRENPALATEEQSDEALLQKIQQMVREQQEDFGRILTQQLLPALQKENIHLYYNEVVAPVHQQIINDLFHTRILSYLQPVLLEGNEPVMLHNNGLYFIIQLQNHESVQYAVLNIPQEAVGRFVSLPDIEGKHQIIFIDDAIRQNIQYAFPGKQIKSVYSFKMTLNGDVGIQDETSAELEDEIRQMISKRETSLPTRFLYESGMAEEIQFFIKTYFHLTDAEMVAGGRYHNLKDLADLPNPKGKSLLYAPMPPLPHPVLKNKVSVLQAIEDQDLLIHLPYQSYDYILRFFNEAAIHPDVTEIYVTLYRVAADSQIASTLISAAKNGKKVTAFVELKARFDEANNLNWAKKMKAAGVRIVYSIPNMKVHAKLALVKRKEDRKSKYYALLATGNFNERTARFYTDHVLMTTDKEITQDVDLLFAYLPSRQQPEEYDFIRFQKLMVARFNMQDRFEEMIRREMAHQQAGRKAEITIKLNNLQEKEMINLLYEASNAGVKINLIVRSICCLVPGVPGMSENISVRRIVDRYLEHARVFIFGNDGEEAFYLGSADWMVRNLHRRIESVFPLKDEKLKQEIREIIHLQLADNVQARLINSAGEMVMPEVNGERIAAQEAIYKKLSPKS